MTRETLLFIVYHIIINLIITETYLENYFLKFIKLAWALINFWSNIVEESKLILLIRWSHLWYVSFFYQIFNFLKLLHFIFVKLINFDVCSHDAKYGRPEVLPRVVMPLLLLVSNWAYIQRMGSEWRSSFKGTSFIN